MLSGKFNLLRLGVQWTVDGLLISNSCPWAGIQYTEVQVDSSYHGVGNVWLSALSQKVEEGLVRLCGYFIGFEGMDTFGSDKANSG